jgi:sodium/potassium-transporting ATPase subunit alpha
MGVSGTEVAKEAADIILLDDNFASIVQAIQSGRTVYDNIKSFILYILTSNTPEIIPFLFFVLLGWPLALPVLLILCIDLGTDMFPAIALGMEPAPPDIMNQKPRDPKRKILNWKMIARSYGFIGPLQTFFAYIVFFSILFNGGWTWGKPLGITNLLYLSAITGFFGTVVVTQIFNVFACRTSRVSVFSKGLFSNKFILIGISIEVLLLLFISYVPFAQVVFGTSPFPSYFFLWMIGFGVVILFCEELRKYLFRHFGIFGLE